MFYPKIWGFLSLNTTHARVLKFGNEHWVQNAISALVHGALGCGILWALQFDFGADEDMRGVLKVFAYVFVFLGVHKVLHYRIVRVFPTQRSLEVGYRWYFFDSVHRLSLDDFSKLRIVRNSRGSGSGMSRDLLILAGRDKQEDLTLLADISSSLVRGKAINLASAIGFTLFEEHANNNAITEISVNEQEDG